MAPVTLVQIVQVLSLFGCGAAMFLLGLVDDWKGLNQLLRFGLQIGGQSVDLVLIVMNRRGLENLLRNEFKVGGNASAVVGPVGRDVEASTDIQLQAEILSYSRTRGVFAGVVLQGSTIRADRDANERFYGVRLDSTDIVLDGKAEDPFDATAVAELTDTVSRYTSR